MRGGWAAFALIGAALAPTTFAGAGAGAAPEPDDLALVLLDQRFGVRVDERWHATLRIDGELSGVDLEPTTTTSTTTGDATTTDAPTTTASDTTASVETAAGSSSAVDPPSSSTGEVPDTTVRTTTPRRAEDPTELRIEVYRPIVERVELAAFLDGDGRTVVDAIRTPLRPSLARSAGTLELQVDVPTTVDPDVRGALHLRRPGVYPVAVQILVDGDVVAEHRTLLARLPIESDAAAPLNVAIVASVSPAALTPNETTGLSDRRRADLVAIAELAAAVDGPVTFSLPPDALTGVADEDPALDATLRTDLAGDELVALPSEALDPSSAVAIGQSDVFARRVIDGEEALEATLPGVPSARSAWITMSPVSTGAATMLRNLTFDALVIDQDTYLGLDGNIGGYFDTTLATDIDLADGGTARALVISPLGTLLDPARRTATDPADAAVRIVAELVVTQLELGTEHRRGAVLSPPDGVLPDSAVAGPLASLISELDDVRLVPLSVLASTTDPMEVDGRPSSVVLPATAGPDLSARVARIALVRASATSAASMQLDDADLRRWRAALDGLLTTALTDEQVDATLTEITEETTILLSTIETPQPFDLTLTGRSSTLRLNLRNNADERLRVIVRPRSPKLTFPDGDQLVELEPASATEVVIPVESRSNGTSSIEISLLTPDLGQPVNGTVVLTASVNALTGLGQVITVGGLLALASWWFSSHRRQRRRRLLAAAAAEPTQVMDLVSPDAAEVTVGSDER